MQQTLRDLLKEWQDWDAASHGLAVAIGLASNDDDSYFKSKHLYWSSNPIGEGLLACLDKLVKAGILEQRHEPDIQYRWLEDVQTKMLPWVDEMNAEHDNLHQHALLLKVDQPPLAGRTRYFEVADHRVFKTISRGILFVVAFWSGPSLQAFARFKKMLAELDPTGQLEIVIVNTDGCPDLQLIDEFTGRLHGAGEAAWVYEGKIIAAATAASSPNAFETFTRHLLNL